MAQKCADSGMSIRFGAVEAHVERYLTWMNKITWLPSAVTLGFDDEDSGPNNQVYAGAGLVAELMIQLDRIC